MRILTILLSFLATVGLAESRKPNHLLGAQSPYLLQHLYNPVEWYPWGPEALEKARVENKIIFVSVGYASCHWCHVMERESFENQEIAEFLNQFFVSIKIDRERRPDLDEQFMLVTQSLSGGGGWPNNVFLTPQGAPFFGGSYYPPDAFTQVLQQVVDSWQQDPQAVVARGNNLAEVLGNHMTRRAKAADLTPEAIQLAALSTLNQIDDFNGGVGTAPKFPREPLFEFLLDQAERQGDSDLLAAVTGMLDGMIMGGIHDQVGGGFHRYAVDPEWHVPHFEKMLYTQAMTGRLLIRAWDATGEPRYRRAFERMADYLMREMRDEQGGFFSAQDADSLDARGEKREGAYFTWTPDDLRGFGDASKLLTTTFQISDEGDLDGANVLNLPALPDEIAAPMGLDEAGLYALLDPALEQLRILRSDRASPATDRKILMSWNAAMISTLAEAGHVLDRPDLYQAAEQGARFILDTLKTDSGYFRVSFRGDVGVEAQLPDYTALGLAFVALHDFADNEQDRAFWLQQAVDLAGRIRVGFGSGENGYRMTRKNDGFTAQIPVDDSELPSGNAMALALFVRLSDRMQAPDLETLAMTLLAGLSGHALEFPDQRAAILQAAQEHALGATGPVRYAGAGAVRVVFKRDPKGGKLRMLIVLQEGWHINSTQPLQDYLIPTSLVIDDQSIDAGHFPRAEVKSFGFSDTPLAVFEGIVPIEVTLPATTDGPRVALLQIQACNDEICLAPEELRFTLW